MFPFDQSVCGSACSIATISWIVPNAAWPAAVGCWAGWDRMWVIMSPMGPCMGIDPAWSFPGGPAAGGALV